MDIFLCVYEILLNLETHVLAGDVPAPADKGGFLPVWSMKEAQDVNDDLQGEGSMAQKLDQYYCHFETWAEDWQFRKKNKNIQLSVI